MYCGVVNSRDVMKRNTRHPALFLGSSGPKQHQLVDQYIVYSEGSELKDLAERGAATGVVIRDAEGVVSFASATVVRFAGTPLVAELMAIRDGIKAAIQRRVVLFEVQSDFLQAVHLINEAEVGCWQEGGLIVEIQRLLQHHSTNGVRFVFQEENVVAHVLANYALTYKVSAMWIGVSPPCARHAIERDLPFTCNRLVV
uniref:RNase H type-1 domain-containing protein n=1 Tax=Cannabis sativa TaxID=3483 RepID=A0A803PVT4_CANSA